MQRSLQKAPSLRFAHFCKIPLFAENTFPFRGLSVVSKLERHKFAHIGVDDQGAIDWWHGPLMAFASFTNAAGHANFLNTGIALQVQPI